MLDRPVTRRRLIGTGAAGAGVLLSGLPAGALARRRTRHADVVVVGAGFAGLTAARELVRKGRSVIVLEARGRVGGRAYNAGVAPGVITERGATFVGPTQTRIQRLAKEVGVEKFRNFNDGDNVYVHGGERSTYSDTGPTGTAPPDAEILPDVATVVGKLDQMAREVPVDRPWDAPHAEEWDRKTLREFCIENGATHRRFQSLLNIVTRAALGTEAANLSLLFTVLFIAQSGDRDHPGTFERNFNTRGGAQQDRFRGGTQLVAQRVARELEGRVAFNTPVRRIFQEGGGVRIESDRITAHAKRVVVAIPPVLGGQIEYHPGLPQMRRRLVENLPQGRLTKVARVYDRPFWREDGLSGTAILMNGLVGVTFDDSPEDASRGIVIGFIGGNAAPRFGRQGPGREERLLDQLGEAFGPEARQPRTGINSFWRRERWSRGCPTAYAPPRTLTRYGPALREPVGRIHWAGTETADYWAGYMDGAVRSGERAAREVLDRL